MNQNQIIIQEEPNGTRTLFRVSHENITNSHTKPFGNDEKDSEEKGEKEKSLDQYMEYVPDKCEQDERMASMLKVQGSKVTIAFYLFDKRTEIIIFYFI